MIKPFITITLFFSLSISTFAHAKTDKKLTMRLDTYHNNRFGFSIDYPTALFVNKEYPENGDGVWLKNKTKTIHLTPSASYAMENTNIRSIYRNHIKWCKKEKKIELTYKVQKENWFVLSGYDHKTNSIFYQKHFLYNDLDGSKILAGYTYKYPIAQREYYDKLVETFNKSFSINTLLAEDNR